MAAVENEMKKLTDIAVVLARYDERILAVTTPQPYGQALGRAAPEQESVNP
jgi:hypothetical protein